MLLIKRVSETVSRRTIWGLTPRGLALNVWGQSRIKPMRKIETAMNQAIASGKDWRSGNTSVAHRETEFGMVADVKLHGNLISSISDCGITLYDGGWQSATTKSRLNAILRANGLPGDGVFQRNFQWFLQYDGKVEPFKSGATLG